MAGWPAPGPRSPSCGVNLPKAHESERLSRAVTAAGMGFSQSWLESAHLRGGAPYFKCARRVLTQIRYACRDARACPARREPQRI